jgi:hypothetical protein
MKINKILFIATLFVAITSNAQIEIGNWMMGGSGGISNYKSKSVGYSQEGTNIFISPNVGYFLIDKLNLGASVSLSFYNPSATKTYGLSPYVRYYFLEKEKQINLFSEVGYGFQKQIHSSATLQTFDLKAGTVIFLNSSVGLEVTLNYKNSKNNLDYQTRLLFLGIGFQIHLEKE